MQEVLVRGRRGQRNRGQGRRSTGRGLSTRCGNRRGRQGGRTRRGGVVLGPPLDAEDLQFSDDEDRMEEDLLYTENLRNDGVSHGGNPKEDELQGGRRIRRRFEVMENVGTEHYNDISDGSPCSSSSQSFASSSEQ